MSDTPYARGLAKVAKDTLSGLVREFMPKEAEHTMRDGKWYDLPSEYDLGIYRAEEAAKDMFGKEWEDHVWDSDVIDRVGREDAISGAVEAALIGPAMTYAGHRAQRAANSALNLDAAARSAAGRPDWDAAIREFSTNEDVFRERASQAKGKAVGELMGKAENEAAKAKKIRAAAGALKAPLTRGGRLLRNVGKWGGRAFSWGLGPLEIGRGVKKLLTNPSRSALRAMDDMDARESNGK